MKRKKVRLETLTFYDHTAIAAHLEKMAAKGWMIDRIANYGWIYRKIEPAQLHFAVSYYPKASEFDPHPSEAQQTFLDFCAHSGWTLACTSAQMQIFYNDREDAVPIETDPVLELETIHKSCKRTFFPAQAVLLILGLVMSAFFVMNLIADPIDILVSYSQFVTGVCWLMVIIGTVAEFITYFRWRKRACLAAEQGIFLNTIGTSKLQKTFLIILAVLLAYYAINVLFSSDPLMKFVAVCMGVYIVTLYAGVDGAKQLMKRWKFTTGLNRFLTFTVSFLLSFALVGGIIMLTFKLSDSGLFDSGNEVRRTGISFSADVDEIPLRVEDLLEVPGSEYRPRLSIEESVFLASYDMYQYPDFDSAHFTDLPSLEYEIVLVKMPWLYETCRNTLFDKLDDSDEKAEFDDFAKVLRPEDAALWDAKEVYRQHYLDGSIVNRYLLCYEDRIVNISFDWEVTDAQKQIVGEKLMQ